MVGHQRVEDVGVDVVRVVHVDVGVVSLWRIFGGRGVDVQLERVLHIQEFYSSFLE
jgi:hypothetical protein